MFAAGELSAHRDRVSGIRTEPSGWSWLARDLVIFWSSRWLWVDPHQAGGDVWAVAEQAHRALG